MTADASRDKTAMRICAALFSSYLFVYFHRLAPAVLAVPMLTELAASGTAFGLLSSMYFYGYAAMQVPGGFLIDAWGPRKAIGLTFALAGAGSVLMGLSDSLVSLMVGRALVGVGLSLVFVGTLKTFTVWFAPERFPALTSLLVSVGGLGSLLSTAPLAYLVAAFGWRAVLVSLGVLSLALTAVLLAVVRDAPEASRTSTPKTPDGQTGHGPNTGDGPEASLRECLLRPRTLLVSLWLMLTNGCYFAIAGLWGGPFLSHRAGFTQPMVGAALAMAACGVMLAAPFLAWLSGRVRGGLWSVLAGVTLVQASLLVVWIVAPPDMPVFWHFALFFAFGAVGGAPPPLGFSLLRQGVPTNLAGRVLGVANIFPFMGTAALQPLLGWVLEQSGRTPDGAFSLAGYHQAFACLMGASLTAFACLAAMRLVEARGCDTPGTRN